MACEDADKTHHHRVANLYIHPDAKLLMSFWFIHLTGVAYQEVDLKTFELRKKPKAHFKKEHFIKEPTATDT